VIENDPAFARLDSDVQLLLRGMLDKDPKKRFSTAKALIVASEIAEQREIFVPEPRDPARLPAEWWEFDGHDGLGAAGLPLELADEFWSDVLGEPDAKGLPGEPLAGDVLPSLSDVRSASRPTASPSDDGDAA